MGTNTPITCPSTYRGTGKTIDFSIFKRFVIVVSRLFCSDCRLVYFSRFKFGLNHVFYLENYILETLAPAAGYRYCHFGWVSDTAVLLQVHG